MKEKRKSMVRTPGEQKKMTEWGQWSHKIEWSKPQNGYQRKRSLWSYEDYNPICK